MVVLPLVIALVTSSALPSDASAHDGFGWTQCNLFWKEASQTPNISIQREGFPANGSGDGVINSFTDRMFDAVNRWNSPMANAGLRSRLVWTSSGAFIRARYGFNLSSGLGETWLNGTQPGCFPHSSGSYSIFSAEIRIATRSDWFTQDDSRRGLWEACVPDSSYTCSKRWDFGGVFMHELGHIWHLAHPQTVDGHVSVDPRYTVNARAANCDTTTQATMCGTRIIYRSEARTLEAWDRSSFAEHWGRR